MESGGVWGSVGTAKYISCFSDLDDNAGDEPSASLRAAMLIFLEASMEDPGNGRLCEDCMVVDKDGRLICGEVDNVKLLCQRHWSSSVIANDVNNHSRSLSLDVFVTGL